MQQKFCIVLSEFCILPALAFAACFRCGGGGPGDSDVLVFNCAAAI